MMRFVKMHGLGNDFIVVDGVRQRVVLQAAQIRLLADRHRGVGFDQLLLVEPAADPANDFRYRIFNCDGSEVEQCGNGARCFARFVAEQGLSSKTCLRVETARGVILPQLLPDSRLVRVDMGAPRLRPRDIPFVADTEESQAHQVLVNDIAVTVTVVSMGNPHAVVFVDDVESAPLSTVGAALERHPRFPERVNVGFAQPTDGHSLRLRVFERGANETLACGSGACAAAVAGILAGHVSSPVTVRMRGGELTIEWAGNDSPVLMIGPAVTVFTGEVDASSLAQEN